MTELPRIHFKASVTSPGKAHIFLDGRAIGVPVPYGIVTDVCEFLASAMPALDARTKMLKSISERLRKKEHRVKGDGIYAIGNHAHHGRWLYRFWDPGQRDVWCGMKPGRWPIWREEMTLQDWQGWARFVDFTDIAHTLDEESMAKFAKISQVIHDPQTLPEIHPLRPVLMAWKGDLGVMAEYLKIRRIVFWASVAKPRSRITKEEADRWVLLALELKVVKSQRAFYNGIELWNNRNLISAEEAARQFRETLKEA